MATKLRITDYITKEKFDKIEQVFRRHFQLGLETVDSNGKEVSRMCSADYNPQFCRLVQSSAEGLKRCRQERLRSLNVAIETGQSYMALCHAGIVLVCVPAMDRHNALGALFFGKCLWEPVSQILIEDIRKRLEDLKINKTKLTDSIHKIPIIQGRRIQKASDFLFDLLYEVCQLDLRVIRWRRQRSQQQSEIGQFIQEQKKLGADWRYPLDSERELIGKVKIGD